jgi:transposase
MEQYVGLDVSQRLTAICIIDHDGGKIWQGTSATSPIDIVETIRAHGESVRRVGMETGPLAVWLYHGMRELGLSVDCIHARHVHAALSMQANKTDANDAYGIAQLVRSGWYRPVQMKSLASHELRLLLVARGKLIGIRTAMYNQIRGVLKTFGIVLPSGKRGAFVRLVTTHMPTSPGIRTVIGALLDTWRQVDVQIRQMDNTLQRLARQSKTCRRLMSVPGVGATTAVAFFAAIDDPSRFRSVKDVGPYLGLTPRKYQSGEVDRNGAISKTGCALTRHLLFEAAGILISRNKTDSTLKRWAQALVPKVGMRKATVATARKLATILLSMWRSDREFIAGV